MQNLNSFIKLLGENYYLDFIIEPNAEEVNYERHFIMVHYQDKNYYEQTFDFIKIRQNEILKDCKNFYENSLSEIFLEVSKKENEEIERFLNFNIEAVKVKLKTLKNDCFVDNKKSRYCSILYDNLNVEHLETLYSKREISDDEEISIEFNEVVKRLNFSSKPSSNHIFESNYYLGTLHYRYILLNSLPFKLFHIGQKFIIELERIKELNATDKEKKEKLRLEQLQSGNVKKMKDTYFDKFCELIDDINVLGKYTAIGVMIDLKECIKEIKSETLLELQEKGVKRNDHLEFKINEVEKRSYPKNADINYIKKWINEYQIGLEPILNNSFQGNPLQYVLDTHYKDMEKFSPEKDKAYNAQLDFYQYFCKYYADELINYFNSKKENKQTSIPSKQQPSMKPFKDEYLNVFCKEISDERIIKETCFDLVYEGIIHYVPYLETEVIENLLLLGNDKKDDYLNFAIDKIKKTPYVGNDKINIEKWLKKYNVTIDEFPKFSSEELNHWLNRYYNGYSETPNDLDFILDIQIDFYCYAALVEANKMIDFLQNKKSNSDKTGIENENANQLSVNQAIILLDKLGVFTDKTFENVPNTKKAKLISQLLGKNEKNIKTAIEKLELKKSELGAGYQRDLDKVQQLLNNLE